MVRWAILALAWAVLEAGASRRARLPKLMQRVAGRLTATRATAPVEVDVRPALGAPPTAPPAGAAGPHPTSAPGNELHILEYARPGRRPLLAVGASVSTFCEFVAFKHGRSGASFEPRVREASVPLDAQTRARLKRAWDGQRLLVGLDARPGILRPSCESPAANFERELEAHALNAAARVRADRGAVRAARRYMLAHGAPRAHASAPADAAEAAAHVRALLNWFGDRFHYYHVGCMHADCETPGRGSAKPEHVTCLGSVAPRRHERWLTRASRTELHLCAREPAPEPADGSAAEAAQAAAAPPPAAVGCGRVSRFVRMNSFQQIADARRGRCGEYSYAWLCFLRAAGYRARWVADWRDHVWCEVQLPGSSRWLHTDPCERAFDQPRLYADGWGKRHDYVVAFAEGGCVDVTAHYAKDAATWRAERELDDQAVAAIFAKVNARLSGAAARHAGWRALRRWLPSMPR